jgi:hypothetical protein
VTESLGKGFLAGDPVCVAPFNGPALIFIFLSAGVSPPPSDFRLRDDFGIGIWSLVSFLILIIMFSFLVDKRFALADSGGLEAAIS